MQLSRGSMALSVTFTLATPASRSLGTGSPSTALRESGAQKTRLPLNRAARALHTARSWYRDRPEPVPGARSRSCQSNTDRVALRGAGRHQPRRRPYSAGGTNPAAPAAPVNRTAFTAFAQVMQAAPHQGKTIRLRARVRVTNPDAGAAGPWLRVDRPNTAMGSFDNMQDRPVRSAEWRDTRSRGRSRGTR